MLQKMSTSELNDAGGEGPSEEGCLEKDNKMIDKEEKRVNLNMEEEGMGQRVIGGETDEKNSGRMQDEEMVHLQHVEIVKGTDTKEALADISKVSTILITATASIFASKMRWITNVS